MSRKLNAIIWIIFLISAVALYGDIQHGSDPRGKIENIVGEGSFVWDMDQQKLTEWVKEGKETGRDFTISEIRWAVKGNGQNWVFTRISRMGNDKDATVKRERFWVDLIRVDGLWVTRTKYRFNGGKYQEGDSEEITEKDKGRKYTASCRITGERIILTFIKKKQAHIFRITNKDDSMQVNLITIPDLSDSTINFKKQ
jgi:hypothetical protein